MIHSSPFPHHTNKNKVDLNLIEIVQKIVNIDIGKILEENKIGRYFSYCINKFENFVNAKNYEQLVLLKLNNLEWLGIS